MTMLSLLAIVLLLIFVAPLVLVIALWSRVSALESRIALLAERLASRSPQLPNSSGRAQPEAAQPPEPAAAPPPVVEPIQARASASVPPSPPAYIPPPPATEPPPTPAPASLEERLGTTWAVYLGGAALALGGLFLVRHAIEAGWLGPAARIVLGLILGAGLVGWATMMRLRNMSLSIARLDGAHIPSVLSAAGTVILFGTLYAAHTLYGFIGAGPAFVLLGGVGIGAMLLAAIHGPALAGLGLAAAYAVPVLVATREPAPLALVLYLIVTGVSAMGLARLRGWLWLTYTAVAGAVLWGLLIAGHSGADWHFALMAHVLIQSAIACFVTGIEPHLDKPDETTQPDIPATIAIAAMAGLAVVTIGVLPSDTAMALPFSIAMLALLAGTAYVSPAGVVASPLAAVLLVAVLFDWPAADAPIDPKYYFGAAPNLIRLPEALASFLWFSVLAAGALAATAIATLWTRPRLPMRTTGLFALGACGAPLLALAVAYLRVTQFGTGIGFTFAGAVLAVGFAVLASRFLDREASLPGLVARIPTGAFAAAAIAALAIALVAGLERGYLTVAFALAAAGTAYISARRDIPTLRYMVSGLGLVVLARVVWDPRIMGADLGDTPILNWLLLGYGVPAAAFWFASHVLRQRREDLASHLSDALAILFTALLGVFQIRHFVFGGDPLASGANHLEMGLLAVLFLGLSHALMHLANARRTLVFDATHGASVILAGLVIVFGLGIAHNPIYTNESISGGVPMSTLIPGYLIPGGLALYIARHAASHREPWYVWAAAVAALALIFLYVTLEVRHAFWGEKIGIFKGVKSSEMWATTVAWLMLAIAFLSYGLVRGSLAARAASGLLLAITVVKVGLFDLAGITGLWRALSFLCLGAVLIGIGVVYQKWVFGRPAPAGSPVRDDD